jgi:hypothetical protein
VVEIGYYAGEEHLNGVSAAVEAFVVKGLVDIT